MIWVGGFEMRVETVHVYTSVDVEKYIWEDSIKSEADIEKILKLV